MFIDKKKLGIAGAIVLAIIFYMIGANSSGSQPASVTPTQSAEDNYTPAPTAEEAYLANLHSQNHVYIEANTDSDLLDLGYSVCSVFDQGYSAEDIVNELIYGMFGQEHGNDPNAMSFVGIIIGASVSTLCPEYLSDVEDLVYG